MAGQVTIPTLLCPWGVLAPDLPLGGLCSVSPVAVLRAQSRKHYFFPPSFCLCFRGPEGINEHRYSQLSVRLQVAVVARACIRTSVYYGSIC